MSESKSVNNEINSRELSKELNITDILDEAKIQEVINTFCKDLSKINSLDECGWTPLYRTVIAGDLNASQILISKGANPNIQCSMGETPLYQAVDMCKLDHVKLLIKNGANPNIPQVDGLTPLHAAVIRQNLLIIKYLLKHEANPNIKTKLFNQSPVHLSIKNNVDPMIMLLLVQFNGSLIDKDKFGKRPIDYVCSKEMGEAIEKLKFGKYPNKKLVLLPLFQTPKKYKNWAISKVYSNTIRSNSSRGDLNLNCNTVLKDAGKLKNNIIGTNAIDRHKKINSSKNIGNRRNEIINNDNDNDLDNENNIELGIGKENYEPNIRKRKLSFSIKEESSCNESDKGDNNSLNERMNIKNSIMLKNTNKLYQNNEDDNLNNNNLSNVIFYSKKIKIGKYKNIIKNNNCSKIQKNKPYIKSMSDTNCFISPNNINNNIKNKNGNYKFIQIYGNSKARKGSFSINPEKQRTIQNQSLDLMDFKDPFNEKKYKTRTTTTNNLYIKPILSLNELNTKKLNLTHSNINYYSFNSNNNSNYNTDKNNNNNSKNNNNENNINKENNNLNNNINRVFTFMDKDNINFNNQSESNNLLYDNDNDNNNDNNKYNTNKSRNKNMDIIFENLNSNSDYERKSNSISNINSNRNNNSSLNDYSTINLSKFKTIEDEKNLKNLHYKKISGNSGNTSITTCSYNIDITNPNALYPIYDWLKEINLTCYYKLFMEKRIYNLDKIIYNLKNGICNITKKDILKIGVTTPGHIYRIITKMEIDSEIINNQISNFLLEKRNILENGEINVLKNSVIYCCGCCSVNNQSKYYSNNDLKKYQLEFWLARIKMIKYKENFINNGFDYFEYFILQMFSSIPIDDNILKDELGINSINDRDFILLQINKDIKYVIQKASEYNKNILINEIRFSKNKYNIRELEDENKKKEKVDESSNCFVF